MAVELYPHVLGTHISLGNGYSYPYPYLPEIWVPISISISFHVSITTLTVIELNVSGRPWAPDLGRYFAHVQAEEERFWRLDGLTDSSIPVYDSETDHSDDNADSDGFTDDEDEIEY